MITQCEENGTSWVPGDLKIVYRNTRKEDISSTYIDTCHAVSYHKCTFPGRIFFPVISPEPGVWPDRPEIQFYFLYKWCFYSMDLYGRGLIRKECK